MVRIGERREGNEALRCSGKRCNNRRQSQGKRRRRRRETRRRRSEALRAGQIAGTMRNRQEAPRSTAIRPIAPRPDEWFPPRNSSRGSRVLVPQLLAPS
eukprot:ctg_328.g251